MESPSWINIQWGWRSFGLWCRCTLSVRLALIYKLSYVHIHCIETDWWMNHMHPVPISCVTWNQIGFHINIHNIQPSNYWYDCTSLTLLHLVTAGALKDDRIYTFHTIVCCHIQWSNLWPCLSMMKQQLMNMTDWFLYAPHKILVVPCNNQVQLHCMPTERPSSKNSLKYLMQQQLLMSDLHPLVKRLHCTAPKSCFVTHTMQSRSRESHWFVPLIIWHTLIEYNPRTSQFHRRLRAIISGMH